MPISRSTLAFLLPLGLIACQNESPAEEAAEPPASNEDAALDAMATDGANVTPEDTTSLGEALGTSAEEIGAGMVPANTENAEQQGAQPPSEGQ